MPYQAPQCCRTAINDLLDLGIRPLFIFIRLGFLFSLSGEPSASGGFLVSISLHLSRFERCYTFVDGHLGLLYFCWIEKMRWDVQGGAKRDHVDPGGVGSRSGRGFGTSVPAYV